MGIDGGRGLQVKDRFLGFLVPVIHHPHVGEVGAQGSPWTQVVHEVGGRFGNVEPFAVKPVRVKGSFFGGLDIDLGCAVIVADEEMIGQRNSVQGKVEPLRHDQIQQGQIHAIAPPGLKQPVKEKLVRVFGDSLGVHRLGVPVTEFSVEGVRQSPNEFVGRGGRGDFLVHRLRQAVQFFAKRFRIQAGLPFLGNEQQGVRQGDPVFRTGDDALQLLFQGASGGPGGVDGSPA